MAGDEIVQMYIRDDIGSVTRPVKELKGFARISLRPGETKSVQFAITSDKLSFLNEDMQRVVEPGTFTIMVGPSSRTDKLLTAKLEILK
jgi:beta-glucosidase